MTPSLPPAALRLTRGGNSAPRGLHLTLDRNHEY